MTECKHVNNSTPATLKEMSCGLRNNTYDSGLYKNHNSTPKYCTIFEVLVGTKAALYGMVPLENGLRPYQDIRTFSPECWVLSILTIFFRNLMMR